tara:strand:+ start:290 stop:532 length:243 start_codon:yes stop_codon:yes gene_type:complete
MQQLYVIVYGVPFIRGGEVLGVADSKASWEAMINKHYGIDVISTAKVLDVRDSGIEYIYTSYCEDKLIEITIENYQLNEL